MRLSFTVYVLLLISNLVCVPFYSYAQDDQESAQTHEMQAPQISDTSPIVSEIKDVLAEEKAVEEKTVVRMNLFIRIGIAVAIIIAQYVLIRLVWHFFKKLQAKIYTYGIEHFKPLSIKSYRLLETKQILSAVMFLLQIVNYVVLVFQLYLTLPIVFSLFEPTQNLASTLFGYILHPLKNTFLAIVSYIPNLITIVITIIITKYALRTIKFFANQIEKGNLVIPGFYSDWADPTFNILRVLLYAFTIIVIFPYLPGSDSAIFQGVSVFVGILFSLGSSSAIGNLVAGMVITYMRPFKLGDRIKINDIIGYVVEKSPTVTRLRTIKNEYVTLPNQMVLNSSIINYNFSSAPNEDGLILHTDVTVEYWVPWRQVHELLIAAAEKTSCIQKDPKPFVLQSSLEDFYCRYQINVYTKEIGKILRIYSELHQNIQDEFIAAGLDLTSPIYDIRLPPPPPYRKTKE
jgi:small-conductance mechanosensitive channel